MNALDSIKTIAVQLLAFGLWQWAFKSSQHSFAMVALNQLFAFTATYFLTAVRVKVVVVSGLTGSPLLWISLTIQIHMVRQFPVASIPSPSVWMLIPRCFVQLFTPPQ